MSSSKTYYRRRIDPELGNDSFPDDPIEIWGCTDVNALNFNPLATNDDGSCTYPSTVLGCTDNTALNFNPAATLDDGSCLYPADPAPNYIDIICSTFTQTTIEYSSGLFADTYKETCNVNTNRPVLIALHPSGAPRTHYTPNLYAKDFASRGYYAMSADYGHESGGGSFTNAKQKKAVSCICALIRYLRANAVALGINPANIFVLGSSAGAVTATSTGTGATALDANKNAANPTSGYWYFPINSENENESSVPTATATQSGAVNSSIANYIDTGNPPNYAYHGTLDCTVPYSNASCGLGSGALDNWNSMIAHGIASKLVPYAGEAHSIGNHHDDILLGGSTQITGATDLGIVAYFAALLTP